MRLTSFLPRILISALVMQCPIWLLADIFAPTASSFAYNSIIEKVTEEIESKQKQKPNLKLINDLSLNYELAWIQLTDKNKHILLTTKPAGLEENSNKAEAIRQHRQAITWKGERYIEYYRELKNNIGLQIAFPCPSILEALLNKQIWPGQISLGTTILIVIFNFILFFSSYLFFLFIPLEKVLKKLKSGQSPEEKFPLIVSSEVQAVASILKERTLNLQQEHDRNLSAARSDVSNAFAKEVEDRFFVRLSKELSSLDSPDKVCSTVLNNLVSEFKILIKAGFGLELDQNNNCFRIVDKVGFNEEQSQIISTMEKSPFLSLLSKINSTVILAKEEIIDKKFDNIFIQLACDNCMVMPVQFDKKTKAFLCLLVYKKDTESTQKLERLLGRLAEQISPIWHLVSNYQKSYQHSRHDLLTSLRNRLSLEEYFENKLFQKQEVGVVASSTTQKNNSLSLGQATGEISTEETIFMIFEGDNFRVMQNSFGPRSIDDLIKELAKELIQQLENSQRFKRSSTKLSFADLVYRVGECRFLLILEDSSKKRAIELAEYINNNIATKTDWPHGLPSWSVSCGIAGNLNNSFEDTLEEAMITLDYIKSRKSTAMIMKSSDLPAEYLAKIQNQNLTCQSENFQAKNILLEITSSGKTGILTISSSDNRVFWAYVENGRITKAKLGSLLGDTSIVEYIATFNDGSFKLQDLSTLDEQAKAEMKTLGVDFNTLLTLAELIELGELSREAAVDAKVHLKTPDMIVHPTVEKQAGQIDRLFSKAGKPISKLYLQITYRLWDHCNGRFTFLEILDKLYDCPQSILWMAADFLFQNKLIKFSRLRISGVVEGGQDKEPSQAAASVASNLQVQTAAVLASVINSGPRACPNCRAIDPLNQKFCVHCGNTMPQIGNTDN